MMMKPCQWKLVWKGRHLIVSLMLLNLNEFKCVMLNTVRSYCESLSFILRLCVHPCWAHLFFKLNFNCNEESHLIFSYNLFFTDGSGTDEETMLTLSRTLLMTLFSSTHKPHFKSVTNWTEYFEARSLKVNPILCDILQWVMTTYCIINEYFKGTHVNLTNTIFNIYFNLLVVVH